MMLGGTFARAPLFASGVAARSSSGALRVTPESIAVTFGVGAAVISLRATATHSRRGFDAGWLAPAGRFRD